MLRMILKRLFYFFFFSLLLSPSLLAQNRTSRMMGVPISTPEGQQIPSDMNFDPTLLIAEGAIDTETYLVGPGDHFSVLIGGPAPFTAVVPVSVSGVLPLMDAGSIQTSGKTLAEVIDEANTLLKTQFENIQFEVNLVQPRQFFVHVSGAVPEPGRYPMFPLARLDDAIQQAFAASAAARPDPSSNNDVRIIGSATAEIPAIREGYKPSLRNIIVHSADSSVHSYDMIRYYVQGDLDHNPYLRDGDVIRLSAYDEARHAILITGDVASPGRIEFREGDTVLDALSLVAGDAELSTIKTVRLTRRTPAGISTPIDLDVPTLLQAPEQAPRVGAGDHLNVAMQETATAAIYGFVEFPGTFPIENGKTTLRELLELAGGLKDEADTRAAYLERRQSLTNKPGTNGSELDFFDRAYFRESMSRNRLSINIESALTEEGADIQLYSGDVIVFPRNEQTVYISGNVLNPGYIPFVPDQTAQYYIDQAGGEAPLTTGIFIFEAGTGKVHSDTKTIVRAGDTIFINREAMTDNPELQALLLTEQASQRQTRIARTQTIITGITALVSVVNTFLLIRDRLNN